MSGYYFKECYNRYRPFADVQGFADCSYAIVLKELNYPLDQSTVRFSEIYQLWRNDVYNFSIEMGKQPFKYVRRVPTTQPCNCLKI